MSVCRFYGISNLTHSLLYFEQKKMAWRMKLRLPSFKLTQRCTRGDAAQYSIPRGCKDVKNEAMNDEEMGSEAGPSWESPPSATHVPDLGDFEAEQGSTSTLHEVKQAANVAAWEDIFVLVSYKQQLNVIQCQLMCVVSFVLVQQSTGVSTVVHLPTTAFHVLGIHIPRQMCCMVQKFGM